MKYSRICFLFILPFVSCKTAQNPTSDENSDSIEEDDSSFVVAFGSCNKQDVENPFWDDILEENPDVWIWGGDNIYADTDDMSQMKSMYDQQLKNIGYEALVEKVPVIGTWDDHDYGKNDAGVEYVMKKQSQQLFLDFMGVAKEDSRRNQEGVYATHTYSHPEGTIKVFVLDTRYFRSNLEKDTITKRRYKINTSPESTVLGETQWKWLEKELSASKAEFNLIITSIQFLSWEHGFETWGNFPSDAEKMKRLIAASKAKGVIVLSGDRHISEFSKTQLPNLQYPLIDFTSSGLTHSYSSFTSEPNSYRVGEVVSVPSYGILHLDMQNKTARMKIMGENGKVYQELKQAY
ncbi:alkaline phosphatase D family protein [Flagellimonas sp. S174]|uniref:alkaline phosphatase D family protein n=1 Tax=Flagellimonas sp. S174 TaxID=3410790 RepID=UPI003BF46EF7